MRGVFMVARKVTPAKIVQEEPENVVRDEIGMLVDQEAVEQILEQYSDDSDIEIEVREVDGRKTPFLFGFAPGEHTSRSLREYLRDEYGTGEYALVARKDGQFYRRGNISVKAGGRFSRVEPRQEQKPEQDIGAVMAAMQQSTRDMIITMQMEAQKQNIELLRTLLERGQPQAVDPITLLATAQKMFQQKDNSVEILLQGMQLARDMKPDEDGKDSTLADIIKTFGKPIAELATISARNASPVPHGNMGSEQKALIHEQQQSASSEEGVMFQQMMIRQAVMGFVKAAVRGAPAEDYAQVFVDQYGDDVADELIVEDEKYQQLFILVPEAVEHRAWFDDVRKGVIAILFEEDEVTNEE
jgi:hypothetical protein